MLFSSEMDGLLRPTFRLGENELFSIYCIGMTLTSPSGGIVIFVFVCCGEFWGCGENVA